MKLSIVKGATSQLVEVFIQDKTSTAGAGLTGLVFNTSGLTCYRGRADDGNAGGTAITLATQTKGTWATGGFVEKDATNMPGIYEFSIPNNALATGSRWVVIYFKGGGNMVPCVLEIELTGWDNQDAVHGGMTALPNTACTTNASLLTSGSGTDQLSVSSGKVLLQATQSGVTIPTVTTVTNQLTAAAIATGVWQDATGGDFTTASSIGKSLYTSGAVPGAAGGLFIAGTNAATTVTTAFTSTFTGNLTGSVASVSGAVGSVTGAVGSVTAAVTLSAGDSQVIQSGTAGAGASTTITIQTALGTTADIVGCEIKITSGTGANQTRIITAYVNSTKIVTVNYAWVTNPDNTSVYTIRSRNAPKIDSSLKISGVVLADTLTTYTGNTVQTGDTYARLGSPAGASVSVDIAAVKTDTAAIKTQTDKMVFTVAGYIDCNPYKWVGGTIPAVNVTGVPLVDAKYLLGTVFSTPATAGIIDVNLKNIANSAVSTSTAQLGVNVVQAGATAWASGSLTSGVFAAGAINNAAFNADTGKKTIRSNTAAAGAAGSITLDASASATDSIYNDNYVFLTGGTGVGQCRLITGYTGSTQVATVAPNWQTNPDNTSTFAILPHGRVDISHILGTLSAGAAGYIGPDWGHVNAPTTTVGLSGTTVGTLTTYTGNTLQTGDSYAALTGAQAEPGQGAPAVNASPLTKLAYLFKAWRNKKTQTATTTSLYADDTTTVDQKATVSDDGTTFTSGEIATGP